METVIMKNKLGIQNNALDLETIILEAENDIATGKNISPAFTDAKCAIDWLKYRNPQI